MYRFKVLLQVNGIDDQLVDQDVTKVEFNKALIESIIIILMFLAL